MQLVNTAQLPAKLKIQEKFLRYYTISVKRNENHSCRAQSIEYNAPALRDRNMSRNSDILQPQAA
jgi:hypothetical protein